jgi:hypothetical protein
LQQQISIKKPLKQMSLQLAINPEQFDNFLFKAAFQAPVCSRRPLTPQG